MEFLAIVGRNTTDHVDVEGIARDLGLRLDNAAKLPDGLQGRLHPTARGDWLMEVSGEDNELRRRFSIAHMIGHWIMHRGLLGQGLNEGPDYVQEVLDQHYNPEIGEREETEANMFAAELLLPSGLVLPLAESGTVDLATAAQRLKCSASGLRIRMELLEYAPEDHGLEQLIP